MSFIDEAHIEIAAGDGGDGMVHFRREAHVPRGGPDGGDGGDGGSVYAIVDPEATTLQDYRFKRRFRAEDGRPGGTSRRTGRSGGDLELRFPLGTVLTDAATGEVVADLTEREQRVLLCKGGRGGRGNEHFKSATKQAPDFARSGRPGQERTLDVDLKLIADVGLIGLPNAGKSTLVRHVSASRATVGAYPFTTLVPNLGVVRHREREFVMADIPGLIEGASEGRGLGVRFLRHVQRAGLLVHLVSVEEGEIARQRHAAIVAEMAVFDPDLPLRESAIALTKIDLLGGADTPEVKALVADLAQTGVPVFPISGATGEGVDALLSFLLQALGERARSLW